MRYIVLSVNDDPVYLFYVPLAVWAWKKIGWEPIILYRGEYSTVTNLAFERADGIFVIPPIPGYRDDTATQVSRLYAAAKWPYKEDYLMTGDIDLIPLSNFWQPDPKKITVYGHDLTNYTHYPICYIGMTRERWIEVMCLNASFEKCMKRDLDSLPQAKNPDFFKYWFTDQDLITQKIKDVQFEKKFIDRGKLPNGLAVGRVDRGHWSLEHSQFIDAHLHRDLYKAFQDQNHEHFELYQKKWREHMGLLNRIWPNEDWSWFTAYAKKFAALA